MITALELWVSWKKIRLGVPDLRSAGDFEKAIEGSGMKITEMGRDMLYRPAFTVATEETEVDLVKAPVFKLGFKSGATLKPIYSRVEEIGLEFCPNEVGPRLRSQYANQPNGEELIIGSVPIPNLGGFLDLFVVANERRGLCLSGHYGDPNRLFEPNEELVLVLPRKPRK